MRIPTAAIVAVFLATAFVGTTPGQTQDPPDENGPEDRFNFWDYLHEEPQLLGDPGGVRSRLQEDGLSVQLFYNYYYGWNARGGLDTSGANKSSHSIDLFLHADLDAMGVVPGGEVLMQVKNNWGKNVNPKVGALSDPIDDADFNELIYIDQFWYQQDFGKGRPRFRVGYLDQQTILDRNLYANSEDKQFMSTLLDNNNAILPLKIGLGATLWVPVHERVEVILGLADADNKITVAGFDTAFDDTRSLMYYSEVDYRHELDSTRGPLAGNYRVGVFYDPRKFVVFGRTDWAGNPERDKGHAGVYLSFDQLVYREQPENLQGLGLFCRYGWKDGRVNRVEQVWSAGMQYLGLFPGRDLDLCGVGMYQTIASDRYRDRVNRAFHQETGVETYYSVQVMPWLTVALSAQFINDPGGLRTARNSQVYALRVRATF